MKKIFIYLITTLTLLANSFDGVWNGELDVYGTKLPLVFRFSGNTGTMDSPKQNAFGMELNKVEVVEEKIIVEIKSISAEFQGEFVGEDIKGTFMQMGQNFDLHLKKGEYITKEKVMRRPQEPKEPFDYNVENIKFKSKKEEFYLSGTLTTPKDTEDYPIVILVSGSGANDRNEELFGHKPFLLLSDYLTSRGIGVFRYDDRGVGESEGVHKGSTTEDFSYDLLGAIDKMRSMGYNKVGVLGHSEGGLIANFAHDKGGNIDFIIHFASPSQRGRELLISQIGAILDTLGLDSVSKAAAMKETIGVLNVIVEDKKDINEKLKKIYEENAMHIPEEQREAYVNQRLEQSTDLWYKYFVKHNPYEHIKNIDVDTLALYGTKDIQVLSKENIEILHEIGNENIEVVEVEGVNHLFQKANTGALEEYEKIEETINEEVLELVYKWVNDRKK